LSDIVDPDVTQLNIRSAICWRGWTNTVWPPRETTDQVKHELATQQGVSVRDLELPRESRTILATRFLLPFPTIAD
jgi:hypothetical protein